MDNDKVGRFLKQSISVAAAGRTDIIIMMTLRPLLKGNN